MGVRVEKESVHPSNTDTGRQTGVHGGVKAGDATKEEAAS
jgi:hypothetical protein